MAHHTTFGIGGPADIFIEITSAVELANVIAMLNHEGIPHFTLGGGANILVGDKGIRGAVLDLSGLAWAHTSGDSISAGAGISVDRLCENALAFELEGLENFYGMPGSIGGALYMNARCYEKDFSEHVETITAISPRERWKPSAPRLANGPTRDPPSNQRECGQAGSSRAPRSRSHLERLSISPASCVRGGSTG